MNNPLAEPEKEPLPVTPIVPEVIRIVFDETVACPLKPVPPATVLELIEDIVAEPETEEIACRFGLEADTTVAEPLTFVAPVKISVTFMSGGTDDKAASLRT